MEENPKTPTPDEAKPGAGEAQGGGHDPARCASILESLLLVSTQPLGWEKIGQILGGLTRDQVGEVVAALKRKYASDSSGILIEEVAKGLQLRTNPANQEYVRQLFEARPARFTRPSLETLAVIAYRQPVTRTEIEHIRGVDCAASLKTLMERRLVKVVGKKDVAGRPFLFGTTREFLEVFGLATLSDLPSMRDIEDFLAAATGGVVPEGPSQPDLFAEGEGELPLPGGDEVAGGLGETDHGTPLVTTHSDIPEGVSDDVLAEEAGSFGEGEAEGGGDAQPAREPASTLRDLRKREGREEREPVSPDALADARAKVAGCLLEGEHAEPLVTAFNDLREGVSDEIAAGAAAMEGSFLPEGEAPGGGTGGERPKKDDTDG